MFDHLSDPGPQILLNLLSNACKFTSGGKIQFAVAVIEAAGATSSPVSESVRSNHSEVTVPESVDVLFSVSDTGVGIEPAALQKLFQPFIQADRSTTRRFGGTGLGLAISQQIAQLMDSNIECISEPGRGSTFSFKMKFPIASASEKQRAAAEPVLLHQPCDAFFNNEVAVPAAVGDSKSATTPIDHQRQERSVLVVDDNSINQKVATRLLEKIGVKCEVASNGLEALQAVNSNASKFRLILMDSHMPVMTGPQTTQKIRELEAATGRHHIPIVAFTADTSASAQAESINCGTNAFLAKPAGLAELRAMLDRFKVCLHTMRCVCDDCLFCKRVQAQAQPACDCGDCTCCRSPATDATTVA